MPTDIFRGLCAGGRETLSRCMRIQPGFGDLCQVSTYMAAGSPVLLSALLLVQD